MAELYVTFMKIGAFMFGGGYSMLPLLVRELVERVASAGAMGRRVRVAGGLVGWVLEKCRGNAALLAATVALMLAGGSLDAHEVVKGDTLWRLGGGTAQGVRDILAITGEDRLGKVALLMDFTDTPHDIADPWYTGDFDATWNDVTKGCAALIAKFGRNSAR